MPTVTLSQPDVLDLQGVAETTRSLINLLKPSINNRQPQPHESNVHLTIQIAKYVKAIQLALSAAYSGNTVAEEVLCLASALPVDDLKELEEYVKSMVDLAMESRQKLRCALEAFGEIRRAVMQAIGNLDPNMMGDHLVNELATLTEFCKHLTAFVNWWSWVKIESDEDGDSQSMVLLLDALGQEATIKRWEDLQARYRGFIMMISEIEDSDPEFFGPTLVDSVPNSPTRSRSKSHDFSRLHAQPDISSRTPNAPAVKPVPKRDALLPSMQVYETPRRGWSWLRLRQMMRARRTQPEFRKKNSTSSEGPHIKTILTSNAQA